MTGTPLPPVNAFVIFFLTPSFSSVVLPSSMNSSFSVSISEAFDNLNKQYTKASTVLQKEGKEVPDDYIACLLFVEDTGKKALENKTKLKLSPTNQKSLNGIIQKVKKLFKTLTKEVEEYKKVCAITKRIMKRMLLRLPLCLTYTLLRDLFF